MGRKVATATRMAKLFRETNDLLRLHEPSFPLLGISESDFKIRTGYERKADALTTTVGKKAMTQAKELENLQLDEMFTANAFAALLADGESGKFRDQSILWWNTYNSRDVSVKNASTDYRHLHKAFHRVIFQEHLMAIPWVWR